MYLDKASIPVFVAHSADEVSGPLTLKLHTRRQGSQRLDINRLSLTCKGR
jgi:hypothetical protein